MNEYQNRYSSYETEMEVKQGLNAYISTVFAWMFIGLVVTAAIAYGISITPAVVYMIAGNPVLFFGIIIGEIVLVVYLSARITKLRFATAFGLFILYAVLNGVIFSVIFLAYTQTTVWNTFLITAATFGVMALYGRFTGTDLTRFRSILFMGLIGVIVLSLVNLFIGSSQLGWVISIIGLFVFLGLTAYDTQKLKGYYYGTDGQPALRQNLGVMGALALYLDFINLFLLLLRLFGRRR